MLEVQRLQQELPALHLHADFTRLKNIGGMLSDGSQSLLTSAGIQCVLELATGLRTRLTDIDTKDREELVEACRAMTCLKYASTMLMQIIATSPLEQSNLATSIHLDDCIRSMLQVVPDTSIDDHLLNSFTERFHTFSLHLLNLDTADLETLGRTFTIFRAGRTPLDPLDAVSSNHLFGPGWNSNDELRAMYLCRTFDVIVDFLCIDQAETILPALNRTLDLYPAQEFFGMVTSFAMFLVQTEWLPDDEDLAFQVDWGHYPERLGRLLNLLELAALQEVSMDVEAFRDVIETISLVSYSYRFEPYPQIVDIVLPADWEETGDITPATLDAYASMLTDLDIALCPGDGSIVDFAAVARMVQEMGVEPEKMSLQDRLDFGLELIDRLEEFD